MKLLLVIVSIIAVFTVDCRDFPDGHEDLGSKDEAQHLPGEAGGHDATAEDPNSKGTEEDSDLKETSLSVAQGPKDNDSGDIDQHVDVPAFTKTGIQDQSAEEMEDQQEQTMQKLRCKARIACVVMGGFCVTNATLCGGRLVPEGCTGTNCQCCVPGTLENKMRALEQDLKSMKDNLTDDNSRLSIELQSMMDNLTYDNSRLSIEFQSRMDNLTDIISNLGSKLDSIIMKRCPVGFFHTSGSSQCYKFYNDTKRSYSDGKRKCLADGLVLAEPTNPISLRKYLVETYGSGSYVFLGARGTGSNLRWERSGRQISNTDALWWSGMPGNWVSTSRCLMLMATKSYMDSQPNQPYYSYACTNKQKTLCEYV